MMKDWVSDQTLSLFMALSCRSPVAFWLERVMHWKMVVCWLCTDPSRPASQEVKKSSSWSQLRYVAMLNSNSATLAGWRPVYHPEQCRLWCNFEAQGSGSMVNMHLESFGKNMKGFLKDPANTLDDCVGVRHGGVHHGKLSNATPFDFRSRNAEWGYRDIDEIVAEASKCGLLFQSKKAMPAQLDFKSTAVFLLNCLVFRF